MSSGGAGRIARLLLLLLLSPLAGAAAAEPVELSGQPMQGALVFGRTVPGARVLLDGRALRLSADGRFVFGFGRDHAPEAVLEVMLPDGAQERRSLVIAARQYDVQRIDGLPESKVTPDPRDLERIRAEAARIAELRQQDSAEPGFASGWIWPVQGRISGVYGSQRILNGEPRQPHFGIDIAAPPGTPVVASTDGVVVMAEPDLFFTGGTVILDHGHGLSGVYSHLETLEVAVGQAVRQGERIGTVGATGRATGPHLDWRVNWFAERLDPALLAGPMPPR